MFAFACLKSNCTRMPTFCPPDASLRTALNHLGLGPCHHMREIIFNMPVQLPFWQAAAAGKPDWPAAYEGYNSAVDWPTAASSAN